MQGTLKKRRNLMVARSLALLVSLAAVSATAAAADPNQARDLAATCASCHGTNGKSVGGMEPLDGEKKQKIIDKINEYKSGAKPATIMHQIAKGYTDQQMELIADYFSQQK
jgi:cytochrome subunit of sulfide dehydrogenase